MSNRSETFGRLLKGAINSIATYEGTTAPFIEEELAEKVGLAGSAIQRYKTGYLPPEPRTIEIIAEAAVRRGFLAREWLQRFLHAARYHQADKLMDHLCPIGPVRPRPPRVYQNLPAPTYSQFVMRQEAFAEVLDGLSKRSAAVIIVGLGGNGKTSLAREIADYCLKSEEGVARFDAAVWVSDKDRPGTTNFSIVLDEIARTLDYPGFTQFEHSEKRHEVEQLLRRQRVLVCIDNFETITDGALLTWLLNMPEPSKVLITTREYRREYRRGGWPVELRGMSDSESRALIDERLKVLHIEKLVSDQSQLEPLVAATGGNPKAIEITLGLVKYERCPLQQVVDDLYAARGKLFDDLFSRAWSLLDEAARRVLMIMSFFSASTGYDALSATADVQGFPFDRAVERLADLALLDVQQTALNNPSRYTIHALVRAFAIARLFEQSTFEYEARERWVNWYEQLVVNIGYSWNDLSKLYYIQDESEAIIIVLKWLRQHHWYNKALIISKGVSYYYYVKGDWETKLFIDSIYAEAARHLGDIHAEAQALIQMVCVLSEQGDVFRGHLILERLYQVANGTFDESNDLWAEILHADAMFQLASGNVETAQKNWKKTLDFPIFTSKNVPARNRYWLAVCYRCLKNYPQADLLLDEALAIALKYHYERGITSVYIEKANISVARRDLIRAKSEIANCKSTLRAGDRRSAALIAYAQAHILKIEGNTSASRRVLIEAIDFFERLGMRRELAEAREELRRIDELDGASAA